MRRLLLLLAGMAFAQSSGANDSLSDRLLNAAFADHFTRYFCISRYPAMRLVVQRAYDASRLRFIAIPCRGLKCPNSEYSRGMQILVEKSKELSHAEAKEMCSNYGGTLKSVEEENREELDALYPQKRPR